MIIKQLPLSSRRNCLPAKCIYRSLLMRHEHLSRALVELMQIGKAPAGANPVLHHPPEAFNGIQVVTTVGWEQMKPKLFVPVCQRRREIVRTVDTNAVGTHDHHFTRMWETVHHLMGVLA